MPGAGPDLPGLEPECPGADPELPGAEPELPDTDSELPETDPVFGPWLGVERGVVGWEAVVGFEPFAGFTGFVFLIAFEAFVGFAAFADEVLCEVSVELVVGCTGSTAGGWHGPEATASPCATCAGSAAWLIEIMTTGFVCERVR